LHFILDRNKISIGDYKSFAQSTFQGPASDFAGCINVCCDKKDFDITKQLSSENSSVFCSFGIHPHEAKTYDEAVEQQIIEEMKSNAKAVAVGECGLDFFKNLSPQDAQIHAFTRQMEIAVQLGKPLIVHSRDAEDATYDLMTKALPKDWRIHLHCFTGTKDFALKMLAYFENLFIGFTGAVTFSNAEAKRLCDVVQAVPAERILLETDGPYMSPEPFRGMLAHPGYIPVVGQKIASVKSLTYEELMKQCLKNAHKMYGCFPSALAV